MKVFVNTIKATCNMKCMIIPAIWSHGNSNKSFNEKFGSHTGKIFNRFSTKDSYTGNITQYGKHCSL